jgi:hypothetical protein
MKEIRIHPTVQLLTLLAALGLVGAAIALQLPELKRYLKIRSM